MGRVDFVIGDRLVVEVDSKEFHWNDAAYHRDRDRDQRLVSMGYIVIRITWEQVMLHWQEVEELILGLVRSNRHRDRRQPHRR